MKKFIRFVALLVLLCISLSGCSYLDELRASRAVSNEDDTIVICDGVRYLLLPENEYFYPDFTDDSTIYFIDDEEIPLLLTDILGSWGYKSKDGRFLQDDSAITQNYCREDLYDSIVKRMNEGFEPELYCYSYYDYAVYESRLYTLTSQQAEAIEAVLASQEPFTLPDGAKLDYDYQVYLHRYSNDYLFREFSVKIGFADGTFYVVDGELIYKVPNSYYVTFARAVKKYLE